MRSTITRGLAIAAILTAGAFTPAVASAQTVDQAACDAATATVKKDRTAVTRATTRVSDASKALKSAQAKQKKAKTTKAKKAAKKRVTAASKTLKSRKSALQKAKDKLAGDKEAAQQLCTPGY